MRDVCRATCREWVVPRKSNLLARSVRRFVERPKYNVAWLTSPPQATDRAGTVLRRYNLLAGLCSNIYHVRAAGPNTGVFATQLQSIGYAACVPTTYLYSFVMFRGGPIIGFGGCKWTQPRAEGHCLRYPALFSFLIPIDLGLWTWREEEDPKARKLYK